MSATNYKPISKSSSILLMVLAIGFSLSTGLGARAHTVSSANLSSSEDDDLAAADDIGDGGSATREDMQSCISNGLNAGNSVDCNYNGTKVHVTLGQQTRQVKKRVEGTVDQFTTEDKSELSVNVTAAEFCESCNKEIEEKTTIALPIKTMENLEELNDKIMATLEKQTNHLERRKQHAQSLRARMDNCEIDSSRRKITSDTAKYQCFIDHLSAWNNDEEKGASYFNEHLRDHLKQLIESTDKAEVARGTDMLNAINNSTNVTNAYIKKSAQEMAKFVDYRQKDEQTLQNIQQQRTQMAANLQQIQNQMNAYCGVTNSKDPSYNMARQQCNILKQNYQNQANQANQQLTAMNNQYSQYKNTFDTYFRNEGLQVQNMNFAAPFENQALGSDVNEFIAQLDQQYNSIVNQHADAVNSMNSNPRFMRGYQNGVTPNMNMVQTPGLSGLNTGNANVIPTVANGANSNLFNLNNNGLFNTNPTVNMNATAPTVRATTPTAAGLSGIPQFGSRVGR